MATGWPLLTEARAGFLEDRPFRNRALGDKIFSKQSEEKKNFTKWLQVCSSRFGCSSFDPIFHYHNNQLLSRYMS